MKLHDHQDRTMSAKGFKGAQLFQSFTGSYMEGRCFRFFHEFATSAVLRFVATKPCLLTEQVLYVDAGVARLTTYADGTPGGTFTTSTNLYPRNGLVPYTLGLAVAAGGTHTGGIVRDVVRVNAGAGAGAVSRISSNRMLPPGTYYIKIDVTGTTSGVYSLEFEELETADF